MAPHNKCWHSSQSLMGHKTFAEIIVIAQSYTATNLIHYRRFLKQIHIEVLL